MERKLVCEECGYEEDRQNTEEEILEVVCPNCESDLL